MNAIEITGLTKKYGDYKAVDELSFNVESGTMIGFLGVNGAGKSTTINMLSTILKPDDGEALINGCRLGREDMEIRRSIGVVYQQNVLDDSLSVRENIAVRAGLRGIGREEFIGRLSDVTDLLDLGDILNKKYKILSGGQKRRCEIAAALIHAPHILFLDEPTTGLDPATRIEVWNAVSSLRADRNMTVFLTTHYMEEAACADKIVIIDKGRKLSEGTPFELKEKFARDRIRLYFESQAADTVKDVIKDKDYIAQPYGADVYINNSFESIDICSRLHGTISGFEVIQGNMDDVFINVTREDR